MVTHFYILLTYRVIKWTKWMQTMRHLPGGPCIIHILDSDFKQASAIFRIACFWDSFNWLWSNKRNTLRYKVYYHKWNDKIWSSVQFRESLTYHLHLHGEWVSLLLSCFAYYSHEDGGSMVLWNVRLSLHYIALQRGKPYFSQTLPSEPQLQHGYTCS
jgi:hypothetical protein